MLGFGVSLLYFLFLNLISTFSVCDVEVFSLPMLDNLRSHRLDFQSELFPSSPTGRVPIFLYW